MFIGPILRQNLDTEKLLALPEAEFLIPIMVAVNDFTLHDTIVSSVQTALTTHRYNKDLDENEMRASKTLLQVR